MVFDSWPGYSKALKSNGWNNGFIRLKSHHVYVNVLKGTYLEHGCTISEIALPVTDEISRQFILISNFNSTIQDIEHHRQL